MHALRRLALIALAPLAVGCGGGNGDAPSIPAGELFGSGDRISDVLGEATWLQPGNTDSTGCAIPQDRSVYVTGVTVTAIDRFDETGKGAQGNYYIQDSPQRYGPDDPVERRGMTVYRPSFSPPDLRLTQGDVTDLLGVFMEFAGPSTGRFPECRTLPEMGGTMSFRFENGIVPPTVVTLEELQSYDTARKYLGMLIRLENVTIAATPATDTSGRFSAPLVVGVPTSDVVSLSNELYDVLAEGPPLALNDTFTAVTGILTYFYAFKIAPRSPADFAP